MPQRHSATTVVIPIRSFVAGKHRLAKTLCDEDRSRLIRIMAQNVLDAANDLPTLIVHDDDAVAAWADEQNVGAIRPQSGSLNGDLEAARIALARGGVARMLITHADLPLASDLRPLAALEGFVLVPDDRQDGTNVFGLPTATDFRFHYGKQSFNRHYSCVEQLGLATTVVYDPHLELDIDEPSDLAKIASREPYRSQLTGSDPT